MVPVLAAGLALPVVAAAQRLVDPMRTPGGAIGAQLGAAAASIAQMRALALERQSHIVALRAQVGACGGCADGPALRRDLHRAEAEERAIYDRTSRIVMTNGGGRPMMQFLDRITDPLNLRGQERAAAAQEIERAARLTALRTTYCYAVTADDAAEQACTQQVTLHDFDLSLAQAQAECAGKPNQPACLDEHALAPGMRREIAAACGLHVGEVDAPPFEVIGRCRHHSRPPPPQDVRARVQPLEPVAGGSSAGLSGRPLQFDTAAVMRAWVGSGAYRTVDCTYSLGPGAPGGTERFWYGAAPPGAAQLVARVREIVPPQVTLIGVFTLGGAGITTCPPTRAEAEALKREMMMAEVTLDPGAIVAQRRMHPAGGAVVKLLVPRNRDGLRDAGAERRLRALAAAMEARRMPLLECVYTPVPIGPGSYRSGRQGSMAVFSSAIHLYWLGEVPEEWPEAAAMIAADGRNRAARPPQGDAPLRTKAHAIGHHAHQDCPRTLADARRLIETQGEPESFVP